MFKLSEKERLKENPQSVWWNTFSACMPFFINQDDSHFEEASTEPFLKEKMQHGTAKHSKEYKDPFTPTIKNNWTDSLDSLLKLKPYGDPNVIIENGHTPLSLAVDEHDPAKGKDRTDMVRILLEHNADPNMCAKISQLPPLSYAVVSQNTGIVKLLLDHPETNVNLRTQEGRSTPLYFATELGNLYIFQMLLAYGADPTLADADNKTPLMIAAENGDMIKLKLILDIVKKEDINVATINLHYTALTYAASGGHEEAVDVLLEAGADPNIITSITSPLVQAIKNGFHEIAKTLLKYGADPTLLNNLALFYAIQQKNDVILVTLLLESGADPNRFEGIDPTPLMLAITNYAMPIFYALLNHEAIEVDEQKKDGTTALLLAVEIGSLVMVKALVEKGADIFRVNECGFSATMLAQRGHAEIYYFLLPLWTKSKSFHEVPLTN